MDHITATGEWVNDRTHGQQFKARFLRTSAPTSTEGIEKYAHCKSQPFYFGSFPLGARRGPLPESSSVMFPGGPRCGNGAIGHAFLRGAGWARFCAAGRELAKEWHQNASGAPDCAPTCLAWSKTRTRSVGLSLDSHVDCRAHTPHRD